VTTTISRRPSAAELDPQRFRRRRRIRSLALSIGTPIALIALWQLGAEQGWIDRTLIAAPSDIVTQARTMFAHQHLWSDTWISIKRILIGFAYGSIAGIVVGVLMGMFLILRESLDLTLTALFTVPKLALLPVFVIIFGFGEAPVTAVLSVTVFFFVWISTMSAVSSVADTYLEAARSFRASRWETFRHVILPSAIPDVFVGLRIAAGVAVLTLIGIEFVFAPGTKGLGYAINQARQLLLPQQAYVGIVITSVIGVVLTWIVKFVGRLLAPWAPKDRGTGLF
jgi:sulfonate transport system permease protein